jgi:septal ring factor EnvC (AmiA/AmiB activator)
LIAKRDHSSIQTTNKELKKMIKFLDSKKTELENDLANYKGTLSVLEKQLQQANDSLAVITAENLANFQV